MRRNFSEPPYMVLYGQIGSVAESNVFCTNPPSAKKQSLYIYVTIVLYTPDCE